MTSLAAARILPDDWQVMQLSDQTLIEFAVLALTGIVVSVVSAFILTDYRGQLTHYAHRCWQFYQQSWYQRLFLWTPSSRAHYADEAYVRRTLRFAAVPGLAMGVFVISVELIALTTGHVI